MMESAADWFDQVVAAMSLSPPRLPVFSNRTGSRLTDEQATSPRYWAKQLRRTARFHACATGLLDLSPAFVVVTGPGDALAATLRRVARRRGADPEVATVLGPDGAQEPASYLRVLARLWESGHDVELPVPRPGSVGELPPYPLAQTRFWAGSAVAAGGRANSSTEPVAAEREPVPAAVREPVPVGEGAGPDTEGAETEATLADLWRRSFGGPAIRPDDNFFELGGSSLQAAQLVNVVAATLVVDVALNDLYEHSTFADFVRRVHQLTDERDASPEFAALLAELASEEAS